MLPDRQPEIGLLAKVWRAFNQLRDHVSSITPLAGPNVRVHRTTRGCVIESEPKGEDGATVSGMRWKREWVQQTYYFQDVVSHNGKTYVADGTTSAEPPNGLWILIGITDSAASHWERNGDTLVPKAGILNVDIGSTHIEAAGVLQIKGSGGTALLNGNTFSIAFGGGTVTISPIGIGGEAYFQPTIMCEGSTQVSKYVVRT